MYLFLKYLLYLIKDNLYVYTLKPYIFSDVSIRIYRVSFRKHVSNTRSCIKSMKALVTYPYIVESRQSASRSKRQVISALCPARGKTEVSLRRLSTKRHGDSLMGLLRIDWIRNFNAKSSRDWQFDAEMLISHVSWFLLITSYVHR